MKIYITIDGGTTNTRISLVKDGNLEKAVKIPVGAKKSIGGNEELKNQFTVRRVARYGAACVTILEKGEKEE